MSGNPAHEKMARAGADARHAFEHMGDLLAKNDDIVRGVTARLPEPTGKREALHRLLAVHAWLCANQHPDILLVHNESSVDGPTIALATGETELDEYGQPILAKSYLLECAARVLDGDLALFRHLQSGDRRAVVMACEVMEDCGQSGNWLARVRQAEREFHDAHPGQFVVCASIKREMMLDHLDQWGNRAVRSEGEYWDATDTYLALPLLARLPGGRQDLRKVMLDAAPEGVRQLPWVDDGRLEVSFCRGTPAHRAKMEAAHLQTCTAGTTSMQKGRRL